MTRVGPVRRPDPLVLALCALLLLSTAAPHAVAGSGPPPTPIPPAGSPSPFPTALRTPAVATTPPSLLSPEAILEDLDSGQVLFRKRAGGRRPIASVTKIMTAMLVLERLPPDATVTASRAAASQTGSVLGLRPG